MIFEISHRTAYRYQSVVTQSQHLVHLAPRQVDRQRIMRHNMIVEPAPTWRSDFVDYYGNPVSVLEIDSEHDDLVIHARTTVVVEPSSKIDVTVGMPWENVLPHVTQSGNAIDLDVVQYALPSPVTPVFDELMDFARVSFQPGRPALAAAWDLTSRIFDEFKFDPTATDVSTPVREVLKNRRGVCQDFAHMALACCRAARMPARYVSGYLLTHPPEGQTKLQGADASHAWISVWTPEHGWVDFDPTNKLIPSDEHITIAFGREFGDVSPVSGVLLGGGHHTVEVGVDVVPQE
ncbi:MAG: transglutaminase family protein [Hyphomicrobiaceae bacterium]|nr:transglutaminase family protein [Hyphomicrobiaceae bacterium]